MPLLQKNNKAFTLAEMLIVVLLLGILATIAVPSIAGAYDDYAIRAAARVLVADINYIRNLAVTEGKIYGISFGTDAYTAFAETDAGVRQRVAHPLTHQPWQEDLAAEHIAIETDLTADAEVRFDGTGVPKSFGTITLTCKTRRLTINVAPFTGRVSVSE